MASNQEKKKNDDLPEARSFETEQQPVAHDYFDVA
jgi:hypothetical protein